MKLSRAIVGAFTLVGAISLFAVASVAAQEVRYGGGNVQAYAATQPLQIGSVVQLGQKDSKVVELATEKNLENMFGVVVDRNQLLTVTSNESLQNETFVTVSGTYNVLVNDQAGTIKAGDYLTMSSVDGIAMKAGTEEKTVLGRAINGFDGNNSLGTTTLKDTSGGTLKTLKLGSIPVAINIQHNPNDKTTKSNLPEFLERLGRQIAEKEVSPIRIYLSLGITIVSILAAIAVLYAGVRNSIISIGRNPMSKKSIGKALTMIILTSLLILIIGLFAVYLLLKL